MLLQSIFLSSHNEFSPFYAVFYYLFLLFVTGHIQLDFHMRNLSKYEGETLRLRCEITGNPLPTYRWMKDGTLLENSNTDDRINHKSTGWGSRWDDQNRQPSKRKTIV